MVKGITDAIDTMRKANPRLTPQRILEKLKFNIGQIKKTLPDDPLAKLTLPKSKDSIYRYMKKNPLGVDNISVMKTHSKPDIDSPWNIGTTMEKCYYIEPQIIPTVLQVQKWGKEHVDRYNQKHDPLTIRQALWVARLFGINSILRLSKAKGKNKNLDVEGWVWAWAEVYAQYEKYYEPFKIKPDTTKLDEAVWNGETPPIIGTEKETGEKIILFIKGDTISMDYLNDGEKGGK